MISICPKCANQTRCDYCEKKHRCVHGLTGDCEKCKINYIDGIMADIRTLNDRIDGLVSLIDSLEKIRIKDKYLAVKPYKCPVCDGVSHLHRCEDKVKQAKNFEFYREYASCHACEGKGIVWG